MIDCRERSDDRRTRRVRVIELDERDLIAVFHAVGKINDSLLHRGESDRSDAHAVIHRRRQWTLSGWRHCGRQRDVAAVDGHGPVEGHRKVGCGQAIHRHTGTIGYRDERLDRVADRARLDTHRDVGPGRPRECGSEDEGGRRKAGQSPNAIGKASDIRRHDYSCPEYP